MHTTRGLCVVMWCNPIVALAPDSHGSMEMCVGADPFSHWIANTIFSVINKQRGVCVCCLVFQMWLCRGNGAKVYHSERDPENGPEAGRGPPPTTCALTGHQLLNDYGYVSYS